MINMISVLFGSEYMGYHELEDDMVNHGLAVGTGEDSFVQLFIQPSNPEWFIVPSNKAAAEALDSHPQLSILRNLAAANNAELVIAPASNA